MKQITIILLLFLTTSLVAQNAPTITSTAVTAATEDSPYTYAVTGAYVDNDELTLALKSGTNLPSWLNFGSGSITTKDFGASITRPGGIAIDAVGNVYVAELTGPTIFKITPNGTTTAFATVATVATGATGAIYGMLVIGNILYIANYGLNKITKLNLTNPGAGETDWINPITDPLSMVEKDGAIYVAQYSANKISKIDLSDDTVTDYVTGTSFPFGLGFSSSGTLYIASFTSKYLSKFESNVLSTNIKSFAVNLSDVKIDAEDNIYVSTNGAGVKKISPDLNTTTDISTTGTVWGMTINNSGTLLWGISNFNKVVSLETGAVLSGTPTNDDVGEHDVCLSVTDGTATTDQCFTITVTNTNDTPTITGVPTTTVKAGQNYSFTPVGDDIDVGDILTYSIVNKPSWASFNTETGELSGTPASADFGDYANIIISVTDVANISVSLSAYTISVLERDTDNDGTPDSIDTDDDDDGVLDTEDDFPLDETEDTDTDNDGTGNNADTDDDDDGVLDTEDDFPLDETEDTDTDNDGTGNNADTDDDDDGFSDTEEEASGTDSKNHDSFPTDNTVTEGSNELASRIKPAEAFTPNGDGTNDTWVVPGIDSYPNVKVTVYNRWGHEVFAAMNYGNDWNGNQGSNSNKLPAGSYLYLIDLGNGSSPIRGWLFLNY